MCQKRSIAIAQTFTHLHTPKYSRLQSTTIKRLSTLLISSVIFQKGFQKCPFQEVVEVTEKKKRHWDQKKFLVKWLELLKSSLQPSCNCGIIIMYVKVDLCYEV